jgi:excisionase family DNA binding protein
MANHEAFFTIRQAAEILGLKYHQLQRGIKAGIFPAYRVGGRLRVRLSEIVAVIEASKVGGAK